MDYIFTYPRDDFEAGKLKSSEVRKLIDKHESELVPNLTKLIEYYMGQQDINSSGDSTKPQTVCNHAKDISDTAAGYFLGSPISWKSVGDPESEEDTETTRLDEQYNKLMDQLRFQKS